MLVGDLRPAVGRRSGGRDDGPVPEDVRVRAGTITLVVRTWQAEHDLHPPVVLVPATGESAGDWDVVAGALSTTRTVHAINLRGHGASDWPGNYSIALMADDLAALLPQLTGRPVDLIAHSLGGLVTCAVAAEHPRLVARLVLEDVALLRRRTPAMPARPPGELDFDWAVVEQVRPEIDTPHPRWTQVAATITAPTLVIAGGATSPVPQEHVGDLVHTLTDGRLITIEAGHLVHHHQPQAFIDAVRDFLGPQ